MTDRDRMWLLVTGAGRCGTGYVDRVLTSCGVKCTHEKVYNLDGGDYARGRIRLRTKYRGWSGQAESSWLAAPFLKDNVLDGVTIVHLVRHPRNVIRSYLRMQFWTADRYLGWHQFVREHLTETFDWLDPECKAAVFWVEWNAIIEPSADITHRIENDVVSLLTKLDIEWRGKTLYDNTHWNTYNYQPGIGFELDDLPGELQDRVAVTMARYGYKWDEFEPTWNETLRKEQANA